MYLIKEITVNKAINIIREADIEKAFLPTVSMPDFSAEKFLSEGELLGFRLFGCFNQENLVGFISIIPQNSSVLNIGPMYIIKRYRGKGLGKWQIEKTIEWALTNKISGLFTKTWGKNIASRKIFENLGFKILEEKLNDRINGDSTVKYFLEIKS